MSFWMWTPATPLVCTSDGSVVWAKGAPTSRRAMPPSGTNELSGPLYRNMAVGAPGNPAWCCSLTQRGMDWHLRVG